MKHYSILDRLISIPAPQRGATLLPFAGNSNRYNFNPRSPAGSDVALG